MSESEINTESNRLPHRPTKPDKIRQENIYQVALEGSRGTLYTGGFVVRLSLIYLWKSHLTVQYGSNGE